MTGAVARQEAAVHRFPATGADIRTVRIDDEVWLVAMDLCRVLEIGRTHDAVRGLDADEGMVDRRGVPYVKHARHLVERPITYEHPHTHEVKLSSQVRVTVDGLEYLRKRLAAAGTAAA